MPLFEVTRCEDREYLATYLVEAESESDAEDKGARYAPPGKLVSETMGSIEGVWDVEVRE